MLSFKKLLLSIIICFTFSAAHAQLGVSYHQSNLAFAGVNYQLGERFLPELRIGTDNLIENTSLELALNFIICKSEEVEFYGGIGGRVEAFPGAIIPIGLNIYPFEKKNFGFHIEVTPIIRDFPILRGSWGIRYRFGNNSEK